MKQLSSSEFNHLSKEDMAAMILQLQQQNAVRYTKYLKHLLTEIPKFMDGTSLDFFDTLMPWSDSLPDICRKTK